MIINYGYYIREYLALFKKTVAMHEVFLQRIAAHALLKDDYNFQTFLEYEGDVSGRGIVCCHGDQCVYIYTVESAYQEHS